MKAVIYEQYGDPSVLKVAELEKPSPKPNELLIKVGASGINPVDTYFRKGIRKVESFPHIPHFDVSGEVVALGDDVEGVEIGDRIWATNIKGTAAEYVCVPAELAFPLANHLSYEDGAAIAMAFMTAHLALFYRGQLQKGETVLIYGGAGAVGHAAIQLAVQAGSKVIATASNQRKSDIAREAGADYVLNYKDTDFLEQITNITEGKGLPLILDVSLSENMENDFEMIAVGGRIVTIGSPVNNTPPLLWRQLNIKNAALLGLLLFTAPATEIQKAGQLISDGFFENHLTSHIGKVFTFDEAAAAHEAIESHGYNGRIILIP
ncbi:NADPH:quinone reductase [Halalkalibacter urbisdiaboli]|uniref:NADPH:quinone reductase n=1 Tax=Halalkalibacter urbisdiaboli TaxID=1960589 RepID=UPI000B4465B3|nr:NADPH:quinone reductase [Halalkalibacter urbisdiaboli]